MTKPGTGDLQSVGVWEDFVDIFHAPSEVFARRRAAGFWTPLLVIVVVATILAFGTTRILEPAIDADAQRQTREMVRENPEMDVSGARGMMESFRAVLVWLVLLVIGLSVIGGIPRSRAAAVVVGIWGLLSLPAFVGALTS